MSISLYDISVPTFLQTVNALARVLDRAEEHCVKTGHDPDDFVEVRLLMTWPHFISRSRQHGIMRCGDLRLRERAHSLRPHLWDRFHSAI